MNINPNEWDNTKYANPTNYNPEIYNHMSLAALERLYTARRDHSLAFFYTLISERDQAETDEEKAPLVEILDVLKDEYGRLIHDMHYIHIALWTKQQALKKGKKN